MKRLMAVATFAVVLGLTPERPGYGQQNFDGMWKWGPTSHFYDPYCSTFQWNDFAVRSGAITATLGHPYGDFWMTGGVGPDGKAGFNASNAFALVRLQGEFSGSRASGTAKVNGQNILCDFEWAAEKR